MQIDNSTFAHHWNIIRDVLLRISKSIDTDVERNWIRTIELTSTESIISSDERHVQDLKYWCQYGKEVKECLTTSDFCLDCRLPSPTLSPERNLLCRLCRRMEVFAEDSTEKPNPFFSLLELISNSGVSAKIQLFRLLF